MTAEIDPVALVIDRPRDAAHIFRVALDDDFGQVDLDMRIIKILTAVSVLICAIFAYKWYDTTHILRWGKAVGATVTKLHPPVKGIRNVTVTFDLDSRHEEATVVVNASFPVEIGQVVTTLVNPEKPKDVVIYADAAYRVATT